MSDGRPDHDAATAARARWPTSIEIRAERRPVADGDGQRTGAVAGDDAGVRVE